MKNRYRSIEWTGGKVRLLDQRLLPHEVRYLDYTHYQDIASAIREMVIRGAPAIGAAAAFGLALAAFESEASESRELLKALDEAASGLRLARPTAVNLSWAIDRVINRAKNSPASNVGELRQVVLDEAQTIADEDQKVNKDIGLNALSLVPERATFIHHCNTGALATVDYGTALGIIRTAHEHGKQVFVYVDETRPRLQGARLTSWELGQLGIAHAVIADGASGYVMKSKGVDLVTVGCDRVAANGDTANKIGTYNLAIVAKAHNVPFYVAAPTSTIDLSISTGQEIKIEERPMDEITLIDQVPITPDGAQAYNPAFDITPAEYITAIITEVGVAYPPYTQSLAWMVTEANRRRG